MSAATSSPSTRPRVLVVDDEPRLCDIISFYLTDAGYDVIAAQSGHQAQALLADATIDAVVTDIRMPNGTGVELLDWIKAKSPKKPVVLFMTAHSDVTLEEAYDKGAEAVLAKPVRALNLLETLARALASAQATRRYERINVELTIELQLAGNSPKIVTKAINLGRGGAFVGLPKEQLPAVGSAVTFRIMFGQTSTPPLAGRGIVRWQREEPEGEGLPSGIGVEFLGLDAEAQERLAAGIAANQQFAYIPRR